MASMSYSPVLALLAACSLASVVAAHGNHGHDLPEGTFVSPDPIDSTLWIHILLQTFAWGVVFPTGMVLGMIKSRWHVPCQIVGSVIAILAYFLGHLHGGRKFAPNAHAYFATPLMLFFLAQLAMGIYLKLHLERFYQAKLRPTIVFFHGLFGKIMPVLAWVQMLFGGIAALGFCHDDHLGQCLAHFIMGSAFVAYGIIYTIVLLAGQLWLRRIGRSMEFFDSIVIAAWGCVNTFTEHRWGQPWVKNDLQHTSMGIVWWCAGLLGVWLSRKRDGQPKRNLIPALVIILTGWAMSGHPQDLHISTEVHTMFGYTLMSAGLTRLIEIAFVLKDRQANDENDVLEPNSFQYLPPFLLYASGFMFMGATEEQMAMLASADVTHVSYILLLFSVAFILYLFVCMLLNVYVKASFPTKEEIPSDTSMSHTNGHANGHIQSDRARQHVRDAEEFELEGLMSDGESSDTPREPKPRQP